MSIKLIELASYTTPAIVENKNKEWVEYGEDNNYYQYLIDLYYGSPTNNAAIKGIADLAMDLKMLGQYAIQLVKSKDKKRYVSAYHFPVQTLRPERCNEDGEIEGYYFAADWSKLKRGQKPKRFAAFGFDDSANECMLVVKPYSTGNYYFAPVDYQGGTQYANLEIEIANFHINNIKNGMAPSMLINFNNGQPPAEVKDMIEAQILNKFSGSSNAGKFILSFNDNAESKADITPVQLSDAHNQYQFLSTESSSKIMMAHRITSPMLLGIKDNTGFGNNAEELKTASTLFDNTVIRPFQRLLIEGVQKIMNYNGYNLDVYFKTLQPLEFTDLSGKVMDAETQEKEYGFKKLVPEFTAEAESEWLDYLKDKGEVIGEEFELIDESPVIDADNEAKQYNFFKRFAEPEEKSKDDKGVYLIRYRYAPMSNKANSRVFCRDMVANAKLGVVYRREDIDKMGDEGINGQFAPSGKSNYSIWKYKGGVNCNHQWYRLSYMRKRKGSGGAFLPLTPEEKELGLREIEENYKRVSNQSADSAGVPFNPPSWDIASTKTIDLPNKGSLKNR